MNNCKRIILVCGLLIGVIMVTSCKSSINKEKEVNTTNVVRQAIDYKDGAYIGDIIKDENVAKEYANFIMCNTLQRKIKDYKVIDVSLDANHEMWIVHYSVEEMILGGDVRIEISKKDGRVNEILFGE